MIERCSSPASGLRPRRRAKGWPRLARPLHAVRARLTGCARDEGGAIVVLIAVSLVMVLAAAGLAIDLGRGYVEQIRLARAVDASALAAARAMRQGQALAQSQADAVQRSNGIRNGAGGVSTSIAFGTSANGETTVIVRASRPVPTTFMRILGHQSMDVGAAATAAVPPVDLVLVLDQSGSLGSAGAWDDLQDAARTFVAYFSDDIDQVGLVSFQVRVTDRFDLAHDFTAPIRQAISLMRSDGYTNTGEGLRLGEAQFASPTQRPQAAKVLVFFTDGRPTAFRGMLGPPGNPRDRVMVVSTTQTGRVAGYYDDPDRLPSDGLTTPDGCRNIPTCFGMNENAVRSQARQAGLQKAQDIRQAGVLIYAIGLGNPNYSDPLLIPDLDYLEQIANVRGRANPGEPQGKVFFAPSAVELQDVFDEVARDLIVRLAQ